MKEVPVRKIPGEATKQNKPRDNLKQIEEQIKFIPVHNMILFHEEDEEKNAEDDTVLVTEDVTKPIQ